MKSLMDKYEDKEMAVAMIWCLQNHFRDISILLDNHGIPRLNKVGQELTVYERVYLLISAFSCKHLKGAPPHDCIEMARLAEAPPRARYSPTDILIKIHNPEGEA